jgi:oligosaccharide repeat unit polymerase
MHPSVVQAGIWTFQLVGLLLFRDLFVRPSTDAIFIVVYCAIMFTIGSYISEALIDTGPMTLPPIYKFKYGIFLIFGIIMTACLYGQYKIFTQLSNSGDFLNNLIITRTLMSVENYDVYGSLKYGTTLSLGVPLILYLLIINNLAKPIHKILFVYVFVVAIFLAVLSTGRGPVVYILMSLGLVYILNGNTKGMFCRIWLTLGAIGSVTFLVFWLMGRSMGKAGDTAKESIIDVISYQYSAIPALSVYLEENPIHIFGNDLGHNTFRFIFALLASIGMVDPPPSLVQEFISVPHLTNIYTSYYFYIKDFGWTGLTLIPITLGCLHDYLYRLATSNQSNVFLNYILVISYLPLLQSIGGETYFTHISTWIQLFAVGYLSTRLYKSNINVVAVHP